MFVGVTACVWSLFFYAVFSVISSFAIILMGEDSRLYPLKHVKVLENGKHHIAVLTHNVALVDLKYMLLAEINMVVLVSVFYLAFVLISLNENIYIILCVPSSHL